MANKHKLKIWPESFEDVVSGAKKFEIRVNDRGYSLGDELTLQEWNPNTAVYSGRSCVAKVVYATYGGDPPVQALPANVVVMGIEVVA